MTEEQKESDSEMSKKTDKQPPAPSPSYEFSVPDVYSNNSEIIIGGDDVAIAFLHTLGFTTPKAVVRISMTHAVFLNFVSYCNTRAKFIQDAYGDEIQTLAGRDRPVSEIQQSFEDMESKKKVVARFDFADD